MFALRWSLQVVIKEKSREIIEISLVIDEIPLDLKEISICEILIAICEDVISPNYRAIARYYNVIAGYLNKISRNYDHFTQYEALRPFDPSTPLRASCSGLLIHYASSITVISGNIPTLPG